MTWTVGSVRLLALLPLMVGAGCRRRGQPAPSADDSSPVVTLERGPCFGRCPEYRVELYESGKVLFEGTRNVAASGSRSGSASSADVRDLVRIIAESGFAELDTAFTYGSAGCGQYYTDMPVMVLSARLGAGRGAGAGTATKTVRYDPGCQGAPGFLARIAERVDSVGGTSVWITATGGKSR